MRIILDQPDINACIDAISFYIEEQSKCIPDPGVSYEMRDDEAAIKRDIERMKDVGKKLGMKFDET